MAGDDINEGFSFPSGSYFIENIGQFDPQIRYLSQTDFGSVGIGSGKVFYDIRTGVDKGHVLVYDTGTECDPEGSDILPGVSNYLRGNFCDHHVGARHFAQIWFFGIWEGIDLCYRLDGGSLKYELYLHPGADPSDIRFTVGGGSTVIAEGDSLSVDLGGGLLFSDTGLKTISERSEIPSKFVEVGVNSFGFDLGTDKIQTETVIDPEITFSIPLGGSDDDSVNDLTVGPDGNVYLVGSSQSDDFPVTAGAYDTTLMHGSFYHEDIVVTCMDPTGTTLVYSTFIGHTGTDKAFACLVNEVGNLVVAGTTVSTYFPITPGAYQSSYAEPGHCFLLEMTADGAALVFSTYFGGADGETLSGLITDIDGNYVITGKTQSDDLPTTSGVIDRVKDSGDYYACFISIISPDGKSLIASTLFGDGNYLDLTDICMLEDGSFVIGGYTDETDYPVTSGAFQSTYGGGWYDCYVAVVGKDLDSIVSCTYFGGAGNDEECELQVDAYDNIYAVFSSNSTFQQTPGTLGGKIARKDLVLAKFGLDLSDPMLTYVGGHEIDRVSGLMLDGESNLLIVGTTESSDFPMSDDAFDSNYDGTESYLDSDSYFTVVDASFSTIVFSTYIGGSEDDDVTCLAFGDTLYIGGTTKSSDLPFTSNPHGATYNDKMNGFLMNIFGFQPGGAGMTEPTSLNSFKGFRDPDCTSQFGIFDRGEYVYVQATGVDGNSSSKDGLRVNVSFDNASVRERTLTLRETDLHTGVYRGKFRVPYTIDLCENLTFYARMDPASKFKIKVDTPVLLGYLPSSFKIKEHETLIVNLTNLGWCPAPIWNFTTDSDWLVFDPEGLTVSGTPTNPDVGKCNFIINISDGVRRFDEHRTNIAVLNIPPNITTPNVLNAWDGIEYRVDYNCDEDNETGIYWNMGTNASWLTIDSQTGVVNGTPTNDDLGRFWVNVGVYDGNSGSSTRSIELTVLNRNDRPIIITSDVKSVNQNENYIRKYEAMDPDPGERFRWSLVTTASWLKMNETTGTLTGTPSPYDVDVFRVNITVTDTGDLSDYREFDITVINVNDPPFFTDTPPNASINAGKTYAFDVNASDPDPDTAISYSISTLPSSDIEIDPATGMITWKASMKWFEEAPYDLHVQVKATDGMLSTAYAFRIEVQGSTPPVTVLQGPSNGQRASYLKTLLRWSGTDADGDILTYDIYVSESQAYVMALKSDSRVIAGYGYDFFDASDLQRGKTYYWTVVPYDGGVYGRCESGVWSFTINNPPEISDPGMIPATVGSQLKYKLTVNDPDVEDKTRLVYTLMSGPDGLDLGESTGTIRWTPGSDQAMMHMVTVNVTDGIDYTIVIFTIDVQKGDESGISSILILVPLTIILLIVGLTVFILLRRRSKKKAQEEKATNGEEAVSVKDEDKVLHAAVTDVPLTPTEAHAHLGKGSKKVSYEDLYGIPAPKADEETLTTKELRDYIHGERKGLEKIYINEQPEFEELDLWDEE